jgi:hypothetical protein
MVLHMPWLRHGNRKYFYRAFRSSGRIVRQYLGSGSDAEKVAAEIQQRRQTRSAQTQLACQETTLHNKATAPLAELCELTDLLMRATLVSQGFRQHCRGAWRRRHVQPDDSTG